MSFGQSAGPPATQRQITTLLSLLNDMGHVDFRDARGPMGFNQRQAGGRFTRDEADTLIDKLTEEADTRELLDALGDELARDPEVENEERKRTASSVPNRRKTPRTTTQPRVQPPSRAVRQIPTEVLAAELQRRGWAVIEP